MLEPDSERIRVAIRIRPLPAHSTAEPIWDVGVTESDGQEEHFIRLKDVSKKPTHFTVDHCFNHTATNQQVFATSVRPIVQTTFDGVQSTILAYGQTSSGKTYSILGVPSSPGILPLTLADVFRDREELRSYQVRLSYYEIFNEKVRDLLGHRTELDAPRPFAKEPPTLRVKEHHRDGFFVEGLKQVPVTSLDEALVLIDHGERHRQYAQTRWNDYSSRSHVLCTISIAHAETQAVEGKMNIVDLAGCENQKHEQSGDGRSINRSLFFLGEVIARLAKKKDRRNNAGSVCSPSSSRMRSRSPSHSRSLSPERDAFDMLVPSSPGSSCSASPYYAARRGSNGVCNFIPYRDSTLTRILRNSLGGTALTCVLCTIHPANEFVDQSMTTLRFAEKARLVENRVRMNFNKSTMHTRGDASMMSSVVEKQQCVIAQLRKELLSVQRDHNFRDLGDVQNLQRELQHKDDLLQEKDNELIRLRAALEGKRHQGHKKCNGNDLFRLPRKKRTRVPDTVERTRGREAAASRSSTFATKSFPHYITTTDTNTRSWASKVSNSSSPSSSQPTPFVTGRGTLSLPPVNSYVAATPPLSPDNATHCPDTLPTINADPLSPNASFHFLDDASAAEWSATLMRAEDVAFESLISDRFVIRQQGAAAMDAYEDQMRRLHRVTVNTLEHNVDAANNSRAAQQHSSSTPDLVPNSTTQNRMAEGPVKFSSGDPTDQFDSSSPFLGAELFDTSSDPQITVQHNDWVKQLYSCGFSTAAQDMDTAGQLCSITSTVPLRQNMTAFISSDPPSALEHLSTVEQLDNSSFPTAAQDIDTAAKLCSSPSPVIVRQNTTASGSSDPLTETQHVSTVEQQNNWGFPRVASNIDAAGQFCAGTSPVVVQQNRNADTLRSSDPPTAAHNIDTAEQLSSSTTREVVQQNWSADALGNSDPSTGVPHVRTTERSDNTDFQRAPHNFDTAERRCSSTTRVVLQPNRTANALSSSDPSTATLRSATVKQHGDGSFPTVAHDIDTAGQLCSSTSPVSWQSTTAFSSSDSPTAVQHVGALKQADNIGFSTAAPNVHIVGQLCSSTTPGAVQQNSAADACSSSDPPTTMPHVGVVKRPDNAGFPTAAYDIDTAEQLSTSTPPLNAQQNKTANAFSSSDPPSATPHDGTAGQLGSSCRNGAFTCPRAVQHTTIEPLDDTGSLTAEVQHDGAAGQLSASAPLIAVQHAGTAVQHAGPAELLDMVSSVPSGSSVSDDATERTDGCVSSIALHCNGAAVHHAGIAEPLDIVSSVPFKSLLNNDATELTDGSVSSITLQCNDTAGELNKGVSASSAANRSGDARNGATMIEKLLCIAMMQINEVHDSTLRVPVPVLPRPVEYAHHKSSE